LWLTEQGDHKGTSSELQTVKDNLAKTKDELKTSQDEKDKAVAARQRAERDAENSKDCLTAAKGLVRASSEEEADKLFDEMIDAC
jgi:pentatricopeptide repeat protein